jgi:large subunit ribosomal protein L32
MAVQQNKKSRSKRGKHNSHIALSAPTLSVDEISGKPHRPHHMTEDGRYNGRQVLPLKVDEAA